MTQPQQQPSAVPDPTFPVAQQQAYAVPPAGFDPAAVAPPNVAVPRYGPSPGYDVPAPYYSPQYAPPVNAVLSCVICGSVPAAKVKFHGHQGFIIFMRFLSHDGPFCRDCGLGTFRQLTSRTLVFGWWGYISVFVGPAVVLTNLVRRGTVAALPAPHPNPYAPSRPPMDPGPRLLQRPLTWIGLAIPVAVIMFLVVTAVTG